MSEPTLADVIDRLDRIERTMEMQAMETRAANAELRISLVEVRQGVHDLGRDLRELWQEHLMHSHPTEGGS